MQKFRLRASDGDSAGMYMHKLFWGYIGMGVGVGIALFIAFLASLPDGKLHVIFCNVGQGDSTYIIFPNGKDMLIDGGPGSQVLACLGRHMPFWDRHIDVVALTHPQQDHMGGFQLVAERYSIGYFVRSDVRSVSESEKAFSAVLGLHRIKTKFLTSGDQIRIGEARVLALWPSTDQLEKADIAWDQYMNSEKTSADERVLGAGTGDLNEYSLVSLIQYGTFDVLIPGDAGSSVESGYMSGYIGNEPLEVLKVPHHGSASGMSQAYIDRIKPKYALLSVGKNSYGHPSSSIVRALESASSEIYRTDVSGDVSPISKSSWPGVS